jgi:MoaA/NifB/PqqE/SkfB family radical SAM enzyme
MISKLCLFSFRHYIIMRYLKDEYIASDFYSFAQCDCGYTISYLNIFMEINILYLEITPTCNNHCAGCGNVFVSDKPSRKTDTDNAGLSLSQWDTLIEKLSPSVTHVNITGGEPTLSPYFDEFIRMIDKKGLSFTLFTNARWNKPQEILNTLLSSNGLKGLLISLHGKDAFTHEAFTQANGSFEHSLENIKLAVSHGIPVTLSTIINRYNYSQVRICV